MQPTETPDDRVAQIRARAEAAQAEVYRLCGGARWTMRVPARPERDSDLVISAALGDIGYLLDQLAEARRQLAEAAALHQPMRNSDGEIADGQGWDESGDYTTLSPVCPTCGEVGACGYDTEGRALIHVTESSDE